MTATNLTDQPQTILGFGTLLPHESRTVTAPEAALLAACRNVRVTADEATAATDPDRKPSTKKPPSTK